MHGIGQEIDAKELILNLYLMIGQRWVLKAIKSRIKQTSVCLTILTKFEFLIIDSTGKQHAPLPVPFN